ncbi:MAG: hypothetical protein E7242_05870 [Lachnospiraceae bacterium]|nr:hypothetical protein [Lachnospiraceae bacterium]
MTKKERKSCINTIETLRRLALNIHGVIDVVDDKNCNKLIELLNGGIDEIYQEHYRQGLKDAVNKLEMVFNPD